MDCSAYHQMHLKQLTLRLIIVFDRQMHLNETICHTNRFQHISTIIYF